MDKTKWLTLLEIYKLKPGDKVEVYALSPPFNNTIMSKADSVEVESISIESISFKCKSKLFFSSLSNEGIKNNGTFSHVFIKK
jgi:protein involved in polysaccharide export with SLBB domain